MNIESEAGKTDILTLKLVVVYVCSIVLYKINASGLRMRIGYARG